MSGVLSAHAIRAHLPSGWEGRISKLSPSAAPALLQPQSVHALAQEVISPFAHFANMALPAEMDSFGGGAVERLGPENILICLIEYSPECAGTALFSSQGLPRKLSAREFNRRSLQRILPRQTGLQRFFTESGRPFCLYVVMGSFLGLGPAVRKANTILRGIVISPAGAH